jgi:hypothetical protein
LASFEQNSHRYTFKLYLGREEVIQILFFLEERSLSAEKEKQT